MITSIKQQLTQKYNCYKHCIGDLDKKLLCLQTESYHRALSKHSERFRSADGDEPLRYASRTLVILRTMKGLRLARAGR